MTYKGFRSSIIICYYNIYIIVTVRSLIKRTQPLLSLARIIVERSVNSELIIINITYNG